ncbi:MAG: inorganic diphosphatase, partial [Verrucomicrobiota bacterium]|nr:inorganic diphosphatase [Verrucomicrobiota bacterium]
MSVVTALLASPLHEIPYRNPDGSYNLFIEIPAGTQQKWEVNKRSGKLESEEKDGKKRVVKFLPYPGNYGFIPS